MKHSQQAGAFAWYQVVIVLILSILHTVTAQQCGTQAGGAACPGGICCSQYGYCGTTSDYCGTGCQSNCSGGGIVPGAQCGSQASSVTCPGGICCSQYGYCGTTSDYCGNGCQSNCGGGGGGGGCVGLTCVIDSNLFNKLWPNRNALYNYGSFAQAAASYPKIATEGSQQQKLREVAAFASHVQQETAGLFYVREIDKSNSYCDNTNEQYPCAPGQKYFGRGPLQLSWNYNYGAASESGIGADILQSPNIVATNGAISFRASFWFWTRTDNSIPSMHDVMVGKWTPSQADLNAGRQAGFGMTINIINGGMECGKSTQSAANRIQYYKQFCNALGVDPGRNLDCASMTPYSRDTLLAQVVSMD